MRQRLHGSRSSTDGIGTVGSGGLLAVRWRASARRWVAGFSVVALMVGLSVAAGMGQAAAASAVATINVLDRPNGVAASDGHVYVTNYGSKRVSVISEASNTVTATIKVGNGPGAVAVDDGHVYVANGRDGTVSVISQATNKVTATITVGGIPITMAAGGGHVYVSDGTTLGRVSVISQATNKVTATIKVGGAPNWMAVGGGHMYVTNNNDGRVSVISQATNKVTATIKVGKDQAGVAADDDHVYVTNDDNGRVSVISQATNKVTGTINVGKAPGDIAINDGHVYVTNHGDGTVSVISQARNAVTAIINVRTAPGYMAVGGGHVYVTNYYQDTVSVAAVPSGCHPFPDVGASNLHCDNIEWLAGQGITKPADGKYHPTSKVTRGSMAAFLFRLKNPGQSAPQCTSKPFPDVSTNNMFCGYIQWAKKTGVAQGNPDGTYKPGKGVTRGAMAAFLQRIAVGHPAPKCTSKPFDDVAVGSTFCKPISWMASNKITFGVGGGSNYGTTQIVNRQSMASFLHRVSKYMH